MNFGHKIAIVYSLFVVLIISMVVLCVKNKDIFLVSADYYKKEIAYQDEINKLDNTAKLTAPVKVEHKNQMVNISFPEELIDAQGEVYFYRPSNADLDFKVPMQVSKNYNQVIPVSHLAKGLWVVKMEWTKDGKDYLREQKIVF